MLEAEGWDVGEALESIELWRVFIVDMKVMAMISLCAVKCEKLEMPWLLWTRLAGSLEEWSIGFSILERDIKTELLFVGFLYSTDCELSIGSYRICQEAMTLCRYDKVMHFNDRDCSPEQDSVD
jgi:hypothetical protein